MLLLPLLGNGVFNNKTKIIIDALKLAIYLVE